MTVTVSPATLHPAQPAFVSTGAALRVALVNNMPDTALASTERQFRRLVEGAGFPGGVELQVFFFPDTPRSEAGRAFCRANYEPFEELLRGDVDALIVTGCEPRMAALPDEPFWRSFVTLVDWTRDNTRSTIWSCLAAHAAVLHLDGVARRRLPRKLSGLYRCETAKPHPLLAGMGGEIVVPHSRYNDLPSRDLASRGYESLTSSHEAGVDMFIKQMPSLFVFLQGHPEYEARSLAQEFRRDVGRFLTGEREIWPAFPDGYFDVTTERALADFAQTAMRARAPSCLSRMPDLALRPDRAATWGHSATRFYANWLSVVAAQSAYGLRKQPSFV